MDAELVKVLLHLLPHQQVMLTVEDAGTRGINLNVASGDDLAERILVGWKVPT